MMGKGNGPPVARSPGMGALKVLAIVLPITFLAAVDVVRHSFFPQFLHSPAGWIAVYAVLGAAVAVFAHLVFSAIQRLQRQLRIQNQERGALLDIGKTVTSSLRMDDLLWTSLGTITEVTSADAAEVWLLEGDTDLALRCQRGAYRSAFLERTSLSIGEGIPGIVAENRKPIILHDLPANPSFVRRSVVTAGYHTLAALPLQYQDELVGVLVVAGRPETALVSTREQEFLGGISEWLALGIQNALLHQKVQDSAVIQERERVAREMHDALGQLLGYVTTQAIGVRRLLAGERLHEAGEELKKMEEIARDLYADVREGILGLRLASVRQGGLVLLFRQYVERYMEMSGIRVALHTPDDAQCTIASCSCLSSSAELQLLRIAQEALTNVRKHSRADSVDVTFDRTPSEVCVTIVDNGRGFDLGRLPATGRPRFGLQSMRERAEAVGGSLDIETAPGKGTRVVARIPRFTREPALA